MMDNKRVINLKHNDLHKIIKESVTRVLKENYGVSSSWDKGVEFLETTNMSASDLMSAIWNWFGAVEFDKFITNLRQEYDLDDVEDEEEYDLNDVEEEEY
jgi:hypothetical protein